MSALPWVWGSLDESESSSMGVGVLGGGQVLSHGCGNSWGRPSESSCVGVGILGGGRILFHGCGGSWGRPNPLPWVWWFLEEAK